MARNGTKNPVGQWELDLGVVELLYCRWAALAGRHLLHLRDLGGVGVGAVPGPHVSSLGDGASGGQVLVLPVLVGAAAGVVAQPDAKVLPPQGRFLKHLPPVDYGPWRLLHLLQRRHKVPE